MRGVLPRGRRAGESEWLGQPGWGEFLAALAFWDGDLRDGGGVVRVAVEEKVEGDFRGKSGGGLEDGGLRGMLEGWVVEALRIEVWWRGRWWWWWWMQLLEGRFAITESMSSRVMRW